MKALDRQVNLAVATNSMYQISESAYLLDRQARLRLEFLPDKDKKMTTVHKQQQKR
jgi:hypothetical protein